MSKITILAAFIMTVCTVSSAFSAVGCDLNDPDRDVKRLFPGSSGYKTVYRSVEKKGGKELLKQIEQRLGDAFAGLYETADVPYTVYEIYRSTQLVGYIHGVNQKGMYGGIQVFLSLDLNGTIKDFYIQKLTSRKAARFRSSSFAKQFVGLSLKEFNYYDVQKGIFLSPKPAPLIINPAPELEKDFNAILRAVKKNLILLDEFIPIRRVLP